MAENASARQGAFGRIPPGIFFVFSALLYIAAEYLYVSHASKSPLLDFEVYWGAARRWHDGLSIYGVWYQSTDHLGQVFSSGYLYPPFLAAVLSWFYSFDHQSVIWGWLFFQYILIAASTLMLWRFYRGETESGATSSRSFFMTVLLVVCYEPLYWGMRLGQCDAIVLFFFSAALILLSKKNISRASFFLALAAWLKIYPALALLAVALKAPRDAFLGAALATIAVCVVLFLSDAGQGTQIPEFLWMLFSSLSDSRSILLRTDFALSQNICRLGVGSILPACKASIVVLAASAGLIVLFLFRARDTLQLYVLSITLIFFALPTFHFQHLAWLAIPGAYLARRELRHRTSDFSRRAVPLLMLYFFFDQQNLLVYQVLAVAPDLLPAAQLVVTVLLCFTVREILCPKSCE